MAKPELSGPVTVDELVDTVRELLGAVDHPPAHLWSCGYPRTPAAAGCARCGLRRRAELVLERAAELDDPARDRPGKRHRHARDTERAAAELDPVPRTGLRLSILEQITRRGPVGATDDELVGATGADPNSVRPRRVELVDGGWLVDSGERRKSLRGRPAIVWKLSAAGADRLAAARLDLATSGGAR